MLVLASSQAFAQLSSPHPTEDIKVRIDENGSAHVVHIVKGFSLQPIQLELINGNVTNLTATDANNNTVQFGTIQKTPMSVVLNISQRNVTLIKYDLPNIVSNNDGLWTWNYREPSDIDYTDFYFPNGVDTIWANERLVYLGTHGLRQHGNGVGLEYVINEPSSTQSVQWGGKNFVVGVRSLLQPSNYVFDQSKKIYAFDIDKGNVPIMITMPKELLWGPYQLASNQNTTSPVSVYHYNDTHDLIGIIPHRAQTVEITGTTVVPEFPFFVPLAVAISAVVLLRFSGRLSFH